MKKSVGALLTIAIGVVVVAAGPAAAVQARATVPGHALAVHAVGVARDARGLAVSEAPGHSATRAFVVENTTADLRLTVRIQPANVTGSGPSSWLTLSDVVETLEPGASASVSVRVLVPANAIPGDVMAGLTARVEHAVRVSDSTPVAGNPSVPVKIAVNVKGAATAQVSITTVRAVRVQGKDYLEIRFQNVGATAMAMRGQARVGGAHPKTYAVQATARPLASTAVRVSWVKPAGAAGSQVAVATEGAGGDQASWSGLVGAATPTTIQISSAAATHAAPAAKPATSRVPKFVYVLIAAALAALWFVYEIVRALRRRRAFRRRPVRVEPIAVAPAAVPVVASEAPAAVPVVVADAPVAVPVVVSDAQVSAVATQLAELVGALDRLSGRIEVVSVAPAPTPALVAAPVAPEPRPPAQLTAPAPIARPEAVVGDSDDSDGLPDLFDWPTEEELDRFLERRRAASTDFDERRSSSGPPGRA